MFIVTITFPFTFALPLSSSFLPHSSPLLKLPIFSLLPPPSLPPSPFPPPPPPQPSYFAAIGESAVLSLPICLCYHGNLDQWHAVWSCCPTLCNLSLGVSHVTQAGGAGRLSDLTTPTHFNHLPSFSVSSLSAFSWCLCSLLSLSHRLLPMSVSRQLSIFRKRSNLVQLVCHGFGGIKRN